MSTVPVLFLTFLLTAGVAATFSTESTPHKPAAPYEAGDRFPELVLPRLSDGAPASVADFRGRRVLLQIFASW